MANVILYDSFLSKISDIATYSRNARQHSDEQIAQIVRSITKFGFTSPVLLDENGVLIAGHGRLAAARQLGMVEVPAIAIHGLDEARKQALRIADNKLALNASWDDDLLRTELMDLRDVGFDLTRASRDRNIPNICRCRRAALAGVHRTNRDEARWNVLLRHIRGENRSPRPRNSVGKS